MSQPIQGRGRGRGRLIQQLSYLTTSSIGTSLPSGISSTNDDDRSESGFSSASSDSHSSVVAPLITSLGRGRGGVRLKQNTAPADPHWTVNNLTKEQFHSNYRPEKPHRLGDLGEQIRVIANYFPILKFPHKGLVYKYQIQIRNKNNLEIHRDRRRLLYNIWLKTYFQKYPQIDKHKIVFDNQSRLLTFDEPLPDIFEDGVSEIVSGPNRSNKQEQHTVIVQRVGRPVDLSLLGNLDELFHPEALSNDNIQDLKEVRNVLSIVLHEHCSSHAAFIYDRSFFSPTIAGQHGEWDLGSGKALWRGFYSCLVFAKGTHHLLMNLDVKHTVFMKKQPFIEFLCEIMLHSPSGKRKYGRQRNISKADGGDVLSFLDINNPAYQHELDFLLKYCKHLRVRSQDAAKPIIYEIQKIALPASKQELIWKSSKNRVITVQNYYKEHYNVELQYPSLPTLGMHNGSYLPMELVDVEPVRMKKITDEQRALVCRSSTMKPDMHYKSIEKIREDPKQQCFERDPFVTAWNLNIDARMIELPARVLPMPEIVYTDQYRVTSKGVRDLGVWEHKSTKFYKPADFPSVWGLMNLSSISKQECIDFYNELSFVAEDNGIRCCVPEIYEEIDATKNGMAQIEDMLRDTTRKNHNCKFFLVILPNESIMRTQIYDSLKKLCELEFGLGIITQMVRQSNVVIGIRNNKTKWDYAKLRNILLKINTKLNGINSVLNVSSTIDRFFSRGHRIMYVGADLSHPAPGTANQISTVAVVASADDIPNRYFKEVYQQHRPSQTRGESREYIVDMKQIMKSLISQYEKLRGYPPTAIVFFRDGISEGEFDSVFEKELTSIREACVTLSPCYRPYLTYIVVSKRHHTRFFPTTSEKNVLAGTVVDSHDVTHALHYDFYLNSHHGALGTSRPTHYHVLYDDNNLKPNEVQMLTYALCYTYSRCTRSVSIPTPVKYADLLATRAALYVKSDDQSDTESVSSGPRIPTNEDVDINNSIKSERIVLSQKLPLDCPFFL
ncbi:unnamed protein product [Adineta steineri]|uniref:Uncharacterized protein n=1 Tax=Adineta steineri TaxID=433720 RepID=A0A814YP55_9BILA|nr:unnamed protein product [Adineta steineri]CAF1231808.1 unnamed protein product [Adineta steineri]